MAVLPGLVSGAATEGDSKGSLAAKGAPEAVAMEEVACPFESTDAEKERLDQIVAKWEEQSRGIRLFRCKFTRRQYIGALFNEAPYIAQGELTYRWPNKASYHVLGRIAERWERDEKAIRRFDYDQKVVFEHPLPRSENESDSWPIPLLYGVRAADLNRDYWIRINPDERRDGEIWLELHPRQRPVQRLGNMVRWASDVLSTGCFYRHHPLTVILREGDFQPCALCVRPWNGDRTTFVFSAIEADSEPPGYTLSQILCDFARPIPTGWTRLER